MRTCNTFRLIGVILALQAVAAMTANAELVNPGFDDGPLGEVGGWHDVVNPFQAGFWGAEEAYIVDATDVCSLDPHSSPYMLEMFKRTDGVTEVWQAVDVTGSPPNTVNLRAWFNSCSSTSNPRIMARIHTFNSIDGWPNPTYMREITVDLLAHPGAWEEVSMDCVDILPDTEWILVHFGFRNDTMGNSNGFLDSVELIFDDPDCDPVPTQHATWSSIKSTFRVGQR